MGAPRVGQEGQTLIFAGHARLPKSIAGGGVDSCVGLELEVDPQTAQIVELASRSVLPRTQALLHDVLIGRSVNDPIEPAIAEIQRRYHGADSRAICTALLTAHAAYLRWHQGSD